MNVYTKNQDNMYNHKNIDIGRNSIEREWSRFLIKLKTRKYNTEKPKWNIGNNIGADYKELTT